MICCRFEYPPAVAFEVAAFDAQSIHKDSRLRRKRISACHDLVSNLGIRGDVFEMSSAVLGNVLFQEPRHFIEVLASCCGLQSSV